MARVLIVNDEVDLLEAIQLVLESAGHLVRTETTAQQTVDTAKKFHPHVILLDFVLSDSTGDKVLRKLRQSGVTHVPVLLMSALPDGAAIAARMGASGFLSKPFEIDRLLGMIGGLAQAGERGAEAQA